MSAFLKKARGFFSELWHRLTAKKGADPNKKPGLLDKIDACLGRYDSSFLIWSFLLSASVMLFIYVLIGVHPFGENSVLVLDLNGQYVQFFMGLRAILHGDGSLLYSFSRSLGGEFLGIYTYYLASPLSYLVALFPEKNILEALLTIFVLKAGFAGLNFGIFLHQTQRPRKTVTVALSVLYAVGSYSVVMQHNTMWMDALVLLPLLILGLERLIRLRKPTLYTSMLALVLLTNYYIGYMMCLFTAIYFFYYFLAHRGEESYNPLRERRHFLRALLRVGVYTVIGIGIAALLLLPAYYSLTFGKTTFSTADFTFKTRFDVLDFFTKMFPGSYDTVRPEGLPWVYSGVLAILLLPLYFLARGISPREKLASAGLVAVLFASMSVNTLDIVWHGFQVPNWLNYRYSFLFGFVILTMGARALTHLKGVGGRSILTVTGLLLFAVVVLQKLNPTCTTNGKTFSFLDDLAGVWLTIACLAVYGFLLHLIEQEKDAAKTDRLTGILTCFLCVELLLNGAFSMKKLHEDVVISNYNSYHGFYDVYDDVFDQIKEADPAPFYRVDKTFRRNVCDSFVLGYRGLASSTSTLNSAVIRFSSQIGLKAAAHWTEAIGSTPVTNAFLGVKYWVTKDTETVDPLYGAPLFVNANAGGDTGTHTYQNPYALPIAFAGQAAIRDVSFTLPRDLTDYTRGEDGKYYRNPEFETVLWSPFARMNAVYAALTGDPSLTVYDPIDASISTSGGLKLNQTIWDHLHYKADQTGDTGARLVFTLTAPADGAPIYVYFPTKYAREAELYVNGTRYQNTSLYEKNNAAQGVLSIGSYPAGSTVTVALSFAKSGQFYLVADTPYFYTVDETDLRAASTLLQANGLVLSECTESYFEGTLTAAAGHTAVQTTIPYDAGWRVTVNGERVETYKTLDTLLAFDLPSEGEYTVTMRYLPSCYLLGLVLFLVFLLLFIAILVVIHLRDRRILVLKEGGFADRLAALFLPLPRGTVIADVSEEEATSIGEPAEAEVPLPLTEAEEPAPEAAEAKAPTAEPKKPTPAKTPSKKAPGKGGKKPSKQKRKGGR